MHAKSRITFPGAIYLLIIIPISFILIVMEGLYLSMQVSSILIPLSTGVTAGVGAYIGSRRRK